MNSCVMHLPPGGGNSATRNTMSCTAMPAQRTAGALEDGTIALHPLTDDMMGDGDMRRAGQAIRMLSHQHRGAFVLAEPAAVHQFVLVHRDVVVERLGNASVHQGHRKRPRL